jgi:hypothetical protein
MGLQHHCCFVPAVLCRLGFNAVTLLVRLHSLLLLLLLLQVAEIFSADVPIDTCSSSSATPCGAAEAAAGAVAAAGSGGAAAAAVLLRDVAYLDTAVTVVEAHQLMHNLHSIHTFRASEQRLQ